MTPQVVNHSTLENKTVQISHENHKTDGISPLKFMHSTTWPKLAISSVRFKLAAVGTVNREHGAPTAKSDVDSCQILCRVSFERAGPRFSRPAAAAEDTWNELQKKEEGSSLIIFSFPCSLSLPQGVSCQSHPEGKWSWLEPRTRGDLIGSVSRQGENTYGWPTSLLVAIKVLHRCRDGNPRPPEGQRGTQLPACHVLMGGEQKSSESQRDKRWMFVMLQE